MSILYEIIVKLLPGRKSRLEKQLVHIYTEVLRRNGMSRRGARRQVKNALKLCKEASLKQGTAELPENYGELIIQRAREGDPECARTMEKARAEGATEADVRQWWNLSDLQRRMICWAEDVAVRLPMYVTAKRYGLSDEKAAKKVSQFFPVYGSPEDTRHRTGDHRPLPHELRERVERYRKSRSVAEMRSKLKEYASYNALVRDEVRSGNL